MREPIRVIHSEAVPGVTCIDAHWAQQPPADCLFESYVVRRQDLGTVPVTHRGREVMAGPGVYTIQAGQMLVHGDCTDLPLASVAISVDGETLRRIVSEMTGQVGDDHLAFESFRLAPSLAASTGDAVTELAAAMTDREPPLAQQVGVYRLVEQLLPSLCRRAAPVVGSGAAPPGGCPSSRARQHLSDNLAVNVSLDELAALTQTSKYHLLRVFARRFGVPPHTYQRHLRVARARRLLAAGVPAAETAARVGFADQSHLGRHFRAVTAVTPAVYGRRPAGPDRGARSRHSVTSRDTDHQSRRARGEEGCRPPS
ncbi:MAG: helix-turn-helix domain-containing protein [Dermatophilaceae bacterium]